MEYTIREFRSTDAADLARAANHKEVARHLRDAFPSPYTFADAAEFVRSSLDGSASTEIRRAICADDTVIGCISITRGSGEYSKSGEIGYFLTPAYWGRGIMAQAVRELCRECLDGTTLNRVYALPTADHRASRRVLEKAGFQLEGTHRKAAMKDGHPADVCVYALTVEDDPA